MGPVLLVLPSGSGDADSVDGVADHLVHRFTVVSYDRRGLSRSELDDPQWAPSIQVHGEDASRLIAELAGGRAMVFGCSIGAVIGLELASRHPGRVRTLVAHEPPALSLLDELEREAARRAQEELARVYRHQGRPAALRLFRQGIGDNSLADREPDALWPSPSRWAAANGEFFLTRDAGAAVRYDLDLGLLMAASTRIIAAGGTTSQQIVPYRCAAALADLLGSPLSVFPGGHEGYLTHPRSYAALLCEVLSAEHRG